MRKGVEKSEESIENGEDLGILAVDKLGNKTFLAIVGFLELLAVEGNTVVRGEEAVLLDLNKRVRGREGRGKEGGRRTYSIDSNLLAEGGEGGVAALLLLVVLRLLVDGEEHAVSRDGLLVAVGLYEVGDGFVEKLSVALDGEVGGLELVGSLKKT